MIKTICCKEHEVEIKLRDVKEILESHLLFGDYDLIVKLEAEDFDKLGKIVVDKVRHIEGVLDTKTLAGIKFME